VYSKIQRYSPTDSAKTFEKPVSRKAGVKFHPKQVLDLMRLGTQLPEPIAQSKHQLIEAYIDVSENRQLFRWNCNCVKNGINLKLVLIFNIFMQHDILFV